MAEKEAGVLGADRGDFLRSKVESGVSTVVIFDDPACQRIEERIDEVCRTADRGGYRVCTVDRARLRNKYFFGEGYIYGQQLGVSRWSQQQQQQHQQHSRRPSGPGSEKLFPRGECDPIPQWIFDLVVSPLEEAGVVKPGFVNSVAINDYYPGGCIVSHVDPPKLFDRPIVTASFFSQSALSFGCKFSFRPLRTTEPVLRVPLPRGCVLSMKGFAADGITHCVRPEDVPLRRAVIILRHVPDNAPRLTFQELDQLRREGLLPPDRQPRILGSGGRRRREEEEYKEDPSEQEQRVEELGRKLHHSETKFESFKVICAQSQSEDEGRGDELHKRIRVREERSSKGRKVIQVEEDERSHQDLGSMVSTRSRSLHKRNIPNQCVEVNEGKESRSQRGKVYRSKKAKNVTEETLASTINLKGEYEGVHRDRRERGHKREAKNLRSILKAKLRRERMLLKERKERKRETVKERSRRERRRVGQQAVDADESESGDDSHGPNDSIGRSQRRRKRGKRSKSRTDVPTSKQKRPRVSPLPSGEEEEEVENAACVKAK